MADTNISWSQVVWNPTTGCDQVSAGCDNCYALTMAKRLKAMGNPKYQRDGDPKTSGPGFRLTVHPGVVNRPLTWRKPRRIFVNSMSDLFHADVPSQWLVDIFAVIAAARQHTFQLLTKRHARMHSMINDPWFIDQVRADSRGKGLHPTEWVWPIPNLHLGVSCETQNWAEIRLNALYNTPAAVRWVSAEPLLGPLDLVPWLDRLGWLVVGGESGPGSRVMQESWAWSLRGQCREAGVPFFFKQAGTQLAKTWGCSGAGHDPAEWPETWPQEYPAKVTA